jgi:hypothetical protein
MTRLQLRDRLNEIEHLKAKGVLLSNERGTRYYWRALSPEARARKKRRRHLAKAGRRAARKGRR